MTTIAVDAAITDFTEDRPPIQFRIGPDVFTLVADMPVLTMIDFAEKSNKLAEDDMGPEMREIFVSMFELVLTEESTERFVPRLSSRTDPIGMSIINKLIPWILEQYGLRPTTPSESSSDPSSIPADGQSSTANAPIAASTSDGSPSISS
jgi:hypothetical protein